VVGNVWVGERFGHGEGKRLREGEVELVDCGSNA